jgi:hypothetical protein
MDIEIREVKTKADLRKFIHLPAKIHKNHPNWVPPIYMDDWELFNAKKNKSFSYSDTILLLAYRENELVGRVMGIINKLYNEAHGESHARFAWMETWNDFEVFSALIGAIENWAKEKGMTHLVGPLGFSDKDPQGFLYEGFNEPVVISSSCNFPYMIELTEKYGFTPLENLVVYQVPVPEVLPPLIIKINERYAARNTDLKVVEFTSRRKVRPYIYPVLGLVNQTFTEIYGFLPFTKKEMDDIANRFLYLIDPRYIKVVENGKKEVVAFILGMADIGKGIQKARGYLLPFGWIHLLREAKRSKLLTLLLGAVRPDYQGRGLDMLMGGKMLESAQQTGKTTIDSHLELEKNVKVRAEMERNGGKIYKRFRIYIKSL